MKLIANHRRAGEGIMCRVRRCAGAVAVVLVIVILVPTHATAGDVPSFTRSVLIPGLGQAHQGHYEKAAIFAGAAIITGVGFWVSAIYYNEAVVKYDDAKRVYLAYPDLLAAGEVISIGEMDQTYNDMLTAWNDAEDRIVYRNVFLVSFLGVYTLNLIDVLISKPYKIEPEEAKYSIETDSKRVLVTRSFRF